MGVLHENGKGNFINPYYQDDIFSKSKAGAAISRGTTPLGLACIAAPMLNGEHSVKILNLNIINKPEEYLQNEIKEFNPDFVGITATTPLIKKVYKIATIVKKVNREILIVAGGPHPSALPEDVLTESEIDCVVKGEGDFILKMIVEKGLSSSIPNIFYKKDREVIKSEIQDDFTKDLDSLPFPAYELFDIKTL